MKVSECGNSIVVIRVFLWFGNIHHGNTDVKCMLCAADCCCLGNVNCIELHRINIVEREKNKCDKKRWKLVNLINKGCAGVLCIIFATFM